MRWLAIFPAGFTIDAVAAVMRDNGIEMAPVVDGIANLAAKSLVALDKSEAPNRWRLLETTRTYALDKLVTHGEAEHAARCHAAYFRDFFASPMAGFRSRVSNEDLTRHGREIDNVRAALDWCFSSRGDKTIGVDLTVAYAPIWMSLSLMAECCERCERALLSLPPVPHSNAWPHMWLRIAIGSALITTLGPSERAHTVLIDALKIADGLDDLDAQARALSALASVHTYRGEYRDAGIVVERLRQIAHRIGEPAIAIVADRVMGTTLLTVGRPREAQQCLERLLRSPVAPDDQRRSTWSHAEHRALARAMLARALWLQGGRLRDGGFACRTRHARYAASIVCLEPSETAGRSGIALRRNGRDARPPADRDDRKRPPPDRDPPPGGHLQHNRASRVILVRSRRNLPPVEGFEYFAEHRQAAINAAGDQRTE